VRCANVRDFVRYYNLGVYNRSCISDTPPGPATRHPSAVEAPSSPAPAGDARVATNSYRHPVIWLGYVRGSYADRARAAALPVFFPTPDHLLAEILRRSGLTKGTLGVSVYFWGLTLRASSFFRAHSDVPVMASAAAAPRGLSDWASASALTRSCLPRLLPTDGCRLGRCLCLA
jgi:hypothetical protein